jgi:hypothetical protein
VSSHARLRQFAASWAWDDSGVLVQQPVPGPLAMVQSVFAHGELVAFHACQRVREGTSGGSSHKLGITLPSAREHLATLGADLGWHGALSADVILTAGEPLFIDINPRLVEPVNAFLSGVDLIGAMLEAAAPASTQPASTQPASARPASAQSADAQADPPGGPPSGLPGVRTHQLLLAVLGAAQHGRRRDVLRELRQALTGTGSYRHSTEELARPWSVPVVAAALATLAAPPTWRRFTGGATSAYSLSPTGWQELLAGTGGMMLRARG